MSKEAVAETSVAPASNVTAVDGAVRGSPGQVCKVRACGCEHEIRSAPACEQCVRSASSPVVSVQ